MLGMAMLTIVRSSRVMKNPSDRVIRIAHGFPCHLLTAEGIRAPRGGRRSSVRHPRRPLRQPQSQHRYARAGAVARLAPSLLAGGVGLRYVVASGRSGNDGARAGPGYSPSAPLPPSNAQLFGDHARTGTAADARPRPTNLGDHAVLTGSEQPESVAQQRIRGSLLTRACG